MGQSTPTTTMAFDTFEERYREFRTELHPREQVWFDRLVEAARRHSNAINRRPHLDFERPVILAMMMEVMHLVAETKEEIADTRAWMQRMEHLLQDEGMMRRPLRPQEGQERLQAVTS